MSRFGDFPKHINVPIPTDETGMIGRECPNADCEGYFKLQLGTGLKGDDLDCVCPYCGHRGKPDQFWTKEQIEYAKSYAFRAIGEIVTRELKKLEFNHPPRGAFGIGFSMKVKQGPRAPLRHYREKTLETEVVCDQCTLRYSVFGVFAFCPDCARHNSRQILAKNLDVVLKTLVLAEGGLEPELRDSLIQNALEDAVSSFDGFGRELVRAHASAASDPSKAQNVSFQSLAGADAAILKLFGVSLQAMVATDEWSRLVLCFHKRHLIAHKAGVVDDKYVAQAGDSAAILGRKVQVSPEEVRAFVAAVRSIGDALWRFFTPTAPGSSQGTQP